MIGQFKPSQFYLFSPIPHITNWICYNGPGKRTHYTNTQEEKLKHTIHTDSRKDANTQRLIYQCFSLVYWFTYIQILQIDIHIINIRCDGEMK